MKIFPKIVNRKSDNTQWIYAGSAGELSERIFAPNHYYFRPVKRLLFKGRVALLSDKCLMDIEEFEIPKKESK